MEDTKAKLMRDRLSEFIAAAEDDLAENKAFIGSLKEFLAASKPAKKKAGRRPRTPKVPEAGVGQLAMPEGAQRAYRANGAEAEA